MRAWARVFVTVDALRPLLRTNLLLKLFDNKSCQYVNALRTRIVIKETIVLVQYLFHADVTRHTPMCSLRL